MSHVRALTKAMKKMAEPSDFINVIPEIDMYINCRGSFDGMMPHNAASRLTPTQWWITFGEITPLLQKYALRIVSQCTSSSGCERNWSTFALVHTQVRNRLGYEKLHKMVYCHYNLRLRIRQILEDTKEREVDTCGMLMDVSLFDSENPIMDLLTNSMNDSEPVMDEYNGDDHPSPSPVVLEVIQTNRSRGGRIRNRKRGGGEEGEEEEDGEEGEEEEDVQASGGETDEEGEEYNDGDDGDEGEHTLVSLYPFMNL